MEMKELFDLSGRVAIVTGSTRGMGKEIASTFAAAGARVAISSRKGDMCEDVAAGIRRDGGEAIAVPCNISSTDDIDNLVGRTVEAFGSLDILVNNAAVNPYYGPLSEIPEDAYDKSMDSNVKNNLWLCRAALPHMEAAGGGAIVIVSSVSGFRGSRAFGIYSLTKAADFQLARHLAVEWGDRNIRVNCIAPGFIKTDFSKVLWQDPDTLAKIIDGIPLGRVGGVADVAGAALFLASAASAFVTGQTLVIDGGELVHGAQY